MNANNKLTGEAFDEYDLALFTTFPASFPSAWPRPALRAVAASVDELAVTNARLARTNAELETRVRELQALKGKGRKANRGAVETPMSTPSTRAEIILGTALYPGVPREDRGGQVRRQRHGGRDLTTAVIQDVILMGLVGMQPVVVHGGGPQIDEAMKTSGLKPGSSKGSASPTRRPMRIVERGLVGGSTKESWALIGRMAGRPSAFPGRTRLIRARKAPQARADARRWTWAWWGRSPDRPAPDPHSCRRGVHPGRGAHRRRRERASTTINAEW